MSINLGNVLRFFGKADQPGLMNAIVGTPSPWAIIRNIPRMARGEEMRGRNILDRPCREMILEATGDELLEPIIDGEYYRNVKKLEYPRRPARADPEGRRARRRRSPLLAGHGRRRGAARSLHFFGARHFSAWQAAFSVLKHLRPVEKKHSLRSPW